VREGKQIIIIIIVKNCFLTKILLEAPSAWLKSHTLGLWTLGAWAASLGVGSPCAPGRDSRQQPPGVMVGRNHSTSY